MEPGALPDITPALQEAVDIAAGLKEPRKRFAIFVNQDLADPMLDIIKTWVLSH